MHTEKYREGQKRLGFWVAVDLAQKFEDAAKKNRTTVTRVLRDAAQSYVAADTDEVTVSKKKSGKVLGFARRMLRVLISEMGPKNVLREVLSLLPDAEVDKVIRAQRGERG